MKVADYQHCNSSRCTESICLRSCGELVLRELLEQQEVQSDVRLTDAVLDFRTALLKGETDGRAVLEAFLEMRKALGNRYYLSLYRLRHWLENHFFIRCRRGDESMDVRLDARFLSLERIERRARQSFFEHCLGSDSSDQISLEYCLDIKQQEAVLK